MAMRTAFTPSAGMRLIKADYSQIELRIAAVVAGETKMLEAYARGVDIHEETAAAVLGKAVETVTPEDRRLAKAVNFGLLYGQQAKGLVEYAASSYGVTLTEQEAEQIRKLFFARYQGLKRWHSQAWKRAEEGVSEVRTRLGRRRLLPDLSTKWKRFSALVNAPVQGGSCRWYEARISRSCSQSSRRSFHRLDRPRRVNRRGPSRNSRTGQGAYVFCDG
jgi:DNA polymerase-1